MASSMVVSADLPSEHNPSEWQRHLIVTREATADSSSDLLVRECPSEPHSHRVCSVFGAPSSEGVTSSPSSPTATAYCAARFACRFSFTKSKTLRAVMSAATEGAAKKMATSSVPYLHARLRSQRSAHTIMASGGAR